MRFVAAEEIRRILSFPMLVAALESGHRRPKIEIQDGFLGSEQEQYFVRHAVDRGRFMASKLITSFPANLIKGELPAVQAVCILFDGTNGRPLAIMDGTEITYWRTAADSALGAKILAPAAPATLLVVGAGRNAVVVGTRSPHRAAVTATRTHLESQPGACHRAVGLVKARGDRGRGSRRSCVRDAVGGPHLHVHPFTCAACLGGDLRPGTHLDLVGGYTPETREADDEAARRARVFVDRRESAFKGVGDILQPIANGAISTADVLGDLYDLLGGAVPGRRSPSDITFFKNAGGAHLDLMTAELVFLQIDK